MIDPILNEKSMVGFDVWKGSSRLLIWETSTVHLEFGYVKHACPFLHTWNQYQPLGRHKLIGLKVTSEKNTGNAWWLLTVDCSKTPFLFVTWEIIIPVPQIFLLEHLNETLCFLKGILLLQVTTFDAFSSCAEAVAALNLSFNVHQQPGLDSWDMGHLDWGSIARHCRKILVIYYLWASIYIYIVYIMYIMTIHPWDFIRLVILCASPHLDRLPPSSNPNGFSILL